MDLQQNTRHSPVIQAVRPLPEAMTDEALFQVRLDAERMHRDEDYRMWFTAVMGEWLRRDLVGKSVERMRYTFSAAWINAAARTGVWAE